MTETGEWVTNDHWEFSICTCLAVMNWHKVLCSFSWDARCHTWQESCVLSCTVSITINAFVNMQVTHNVLGSSHVTLLLILALKVCSDNSDGASLQSLDSREDSHLNSVSPPAQTGFPLGKSFTCGYKTVVPVTELSLKCTPLLVALMVLHYLQLNLLF